jgi:hypothetical protein
LSRLRARSEWLLPIGILLLALVLRLVWVCDAGFTHDVSFFTYWMRTAAQEGIAQVFATAKSSYPPLSVYLLGLLGLFSSVGVSGREAVPAELLTLRAATIAFDLLTIALLYTLGRRGANRPAATWASLLYALCPGGIYLSGWWVQTDAWFVPPMLLGAWLLSEKRVALAWLAVGLAIAFKLQAVVVLPFFVVGTWRWYGARRLFVGGVTLVLTLGLIVAPLLLGGQAADLLSKTTQPTRYFQWITLESHNLWFALTPHARDLGGDINRDLNAFAAGISFRDAGLTMLALGYALALARLFIRSGPRSIFSVCAVAWIMFFMLPTRIDARYLFPPLALVLCAGFYQRRWWIVYSIAAVTLLVNLVWKSRAISPLMSLLCISPEWAVANAWINVAMLGLGLAFYIVPLLGSVQAQIGHDGQLCVMKRGWEALLLIVTALALSGLLGVVLWRGYTVGVQIAQLESPLRTSLNTSLDGLQASEQAVVINWPRAVYADSSANIGGIIPVTPPAFFLSVPESVECDATWVQYPPWQQDMDIGVEYHGDYVMQDELVALVQQADRVIAFNPQAREMYALARRRSSNVTPYACKIEFGGVACLTDGQAVLDENTLKVELSWRVTGVLSSDVTAFVHVVNADGNLVTQADGDLVNGLVPLANLGRSDLRESRLMRVPPGTYRVRVGLYDRVSGERLAVLCAPAYQCADGAFELRVNEYEPSRQ